MLTLGTGMVTQAPAFLICCPGTTHVPGCCDLTEGLTEDPRTSCSAGSLIVVFAQSFKSIPAHVSPDRTINTRFESLITARIFIAGPVPFVPLLSQCFGTVTISTTARSLPSHGIKNSDVPEDLEEEKDHIRQSHAANVGVHSLRDIQAASDDGNWVKAVMVPDSDDESSDYPRNEPDGFRTVRIRDKIENKEIMALSEQI